MLSHLLSSFDIIVWCNRILFFSILFDNILVKIVNELIF
jgi:hypothetical protein